MFEKLKEYIEKRGMIPPTIHRIESAFKTGKINKEQYDELMNIGFYDMTKNN